MKIKKFTAGSMPEAMKTVRNELGKEAVILNSRTVFTGGFLGFFRKKNIEVIAAVDPKIKHELKPIIQEKQKISVPSSPSQFEDRLPGGISKKNEPQIINQLSTEVMKEINNLKQLIKTNSVESVQSHYPEPVQEVCKWLNEQEVSSNLKEQLISSLMDQWFSAASKMTNAEIREFVKEELVKIMADKPFGGITFTKKYINVIGPTGVGKTTTIAKIAAECILTYHKKVAFITTDTYRIAAIEQLKTYAQILTIPLEVCYSLADFQAAVQKFSSYDVVLIDTAGRNFRNKQYVDDLHKVIDFNLEMETYLVLSLTAKQKDMEDIYKQFSSIKLNKLIFTKADETSVYGAIINMIEKYKIGTAYITNGQDVPNDVMVASPEKISNLLTGENLL